MDTNGESGTGSACQRVVFYLCMCTVDKRLYQQEAAWLSQKSLHLVWRHPAATAAEYSALRNELEAFKLPIPPHLGRVHNM